MYMARFAGAYTAGMGHIDAFASYNFYYVSRGRKQVYLVPRQYNPSALNKEEAGKLHFVGGIDNVFIKQDSADDQSLHKWLSRVPAVFDFQVMICQRGGK